MERARSEWLRSLGIEQTELKEREGLMFVVVRAEVDFRTPARYGDLLQVTCEVAESRRASLTFKQDIVRAIDDPGADPEATPKADSRADPAAGSGVLVTGQIRIACLDVEKFRPRSMPEAMLQEIAGWRKSLNDG
jgi:acyl-CoA thioester hydrolase